MIIVISYNKARASNIYSFYIVRYLPPNLIPTAYATFDDLTSPLTTVLFRNPLLFHLDIPTTANGDFLLFVFHFALASNKRPETLPLG
jgi:hypothetical protein